MTRIYVVTEETASGESKQHLVEAGSQASAIRAIVEPRFAVRLAEQTDLVTLIKAGVEVKKAE